MAKSVCVLIATRGSDGIKIHNGPPNYGECKDFNREESKTCRAMLYSRDGKLFAWCNGQSINVVSVPSFKNVFSTERPRTGSLDISPLSNFIAAWEPYAARKDNTSLPNLNIWNLKTGELHISLFQKRQQGWQPNWSDDEEICARMVNNEVHFFEKNDFRKIVTKVYQLKISEFSVSKGPAPYHVACFSPGSKGQPSFVRMYKYPIFEGNSSTVANKSFFKADKVQFVWNQKGSAVLLMVSTDVDKSGASYYGEQTLHFMSTSGDTSIVKLPKDGPVYSAEWSPLCEQFCVIYGFMPAKATLFNLKCESVFDFGTGPRNEVYYNPRGTLLALAGFGNLQGNIEVWDVKKSKQAGQMKASNTTHMTWSPDGEHILTATTSPRLRVGNGYKTWHYTGSLLMEKTWTEDQELWEASWQTLPKEIFPEKPIVYQPIQGIKNAQPQPSITVYRPPGAKGQPSNFSIRQEYEKPSNQKTLDPEELAKVNKNKRKKENRKARKELEKTQGTDVLATTPSVNASTNFHVTLTGDQEKDKKIRNVLKKLDQIAKLKEQQKEGKQLEINQVDKLKKENELIAELQQLQI